MMNQPEVPTLRSTNSEKKLKMVPIERTVL